VSTPSAEGRGGSLAGRLSRAGVTDVARAERMLSDAALLDVLPDAAAVLPSPLAEVADPDQALLTLAKLAGAVQSQPAEHALLRDLLEQDDERRARLLSVAGASVALGDTLVAHPANLHVLADDAPALGVPVADVRAELLRAVGADPEAAVPVGVGPAKDAPDAPVVDLAEGEVK